MPLHDWTDRDGWEGFHHLWMAELVRWLRHRLPAPYRVFIGSSPVVSIGDLPVKPDVAVADGGAGNPTPPATDSPREPDYEAAVATLEDETSVQVERAGRLVAAVELVSPRNTDRP